MQPLGTAQPLVRRSALLRLTPGLQQRSNERDRRPWSFQLNQEGVKDKLESQSIRLLSRIVPQLAVRVNNRHDASRWSSRLAVQGCSSAIYSEPSVGTKPHTLTGFRAMARESGEIQRLARIAASLCRLTNDLQSLWSRELI